MKFLVPIPDSKYYLWQILVQITNFRDMGYEEDLHIPVIYFHNKPSERLIQLSTSKELKCHWHLYPNNRIKKWYSATMKPYLVGKYFEEFIGERTTTYHYLDPDCIFTKPMDFTPFMVDTNTWFGSDTGSYTGEKYIKSKGNQLFYDICELVGVNPSLIEGKRGWEVGAQYFIKNNDPAMWFEIEDKSADLYKFLQETRSKYNMDGKKPLQIWCCEMYVTQMIALKYGIELKVSPLMNFHWSSHNIKNWFNKPYYHNAGQTKDNGKDFYKSGYKTSPFRKKINVISTSASYNYLQLVRKTESVFPNLIWD
jgi:hypothetical protein